MIAAPAQGLLAHRQPHARILRVVDMRTGAEHPPVRDAAGRPATPETVLRWAEARRAYAALDRVRHLAAGRQVQALDAHLRYRDAVRDVARARAALHTSTTTTTED